MYLGQRGIAGLSSIAHLIAYIVNSLHPPYPVLIISFMFAGLGNGLADSAWNAWVANLANANELLGLLHGFYGLGAVLSPLIATSFVTKAKWPWFSFYYLMVGRIFRCLLKFFHSDEKTIDWRRRNRACFYTYSILGRGQTRLSQAHCIFSRSGAERQPFETGLILKGRCSSHLVMLGVPAGLRRHRSCFGRMDCYVHDPSP